MQQNNPGNGGTANFAARGFSGVGSVTTLVDGMRLFVGAGTVTFPFDPLDGPAGRGSARPRLGDVRPEAPSAARSTWCPSGPIPNMASYDFQAGVGNDGTYRVGVGAGGPAGDQLSYRFDASHNASDGYVDRGKSGSWALSGSVRWAPSDKLSFVLSNDYGNQKPIQYFGTPLVNSAIGERVRHRNYNVSDAILHYKDNFTQLRTEWKPAEGIGFATRPICSTPTANGRTPKPTSMTARAASTASASSRSSTTRTRLGDTLDVGFDSEFGGGVKNCPGGRRRGEPDQVRPRQRRLPEHVELGELPEPAPGLFDEPERSSARRYRTRTNQYGLFAEDRLQLTDRCSVVGEPAL